MARLNLVRTGFSAPCPPVDAQSVKAESPSCSGLSSCGNQLPRGSAPAPRDVSGAAAKDLALYREKFRRRLPASLDEPHGPAHGVVDLPLHMAWSGMTS